MPRREQLERIAEVCLSLHKMADYFLNNEPQNLRVEDFDRIALELEEIARMVDMFTGQLAREEGCSPSGEKAAAETT
jgi:hypothetical protein